MRTMVLFCISIQHSIPSVMKSIFVLAFSMLTVSAFSQNNILYETNGYKINYPSNWTIDTTGTMNTAFYLFAPLENEKDQFKENINLIVQPLETDEEITPEQYKIVSDSQFEELKPYCEVYESSVITSGKKSYYKAFYKIEQDNFNVTVLSYCYIKNNTAYLITFTAQTASFDAYKNTGISILNSFELK